MKVNHNKTINYSQSQIYDSSQSYKEQEKEFLNFITMKRENIISAKEGKNNGKKVRIILPKIIKIFI